MRFLGRQSLKCVGVEEGSGGEKLRTASKGEVKVLQMGKWRW